jgi:hypothetical protein
MSNPPPSASSTGEPVDTRPAAPEASEAAALPTQVAVTGKRLLEDGAALPNARARISPPRA